MTLPEYIINFRDENDLSQRQFANLCGLSNGYIAMIESGVNPRTGNPITPSLSSLKKMAAVMGLTWQALSDIIEGDNISNIHIDELTEDEREIIVMYRELEVSKRNLVLSLVRAISE